MLEKIKELRTRTGISMAKCKKALEESGLDVDGAIKYLQKAGEIDSAKRAGRETKEGVLYSYVHMDKIGVLVEVNCETDFAARSEPFRNFTESVALQIAATDPLSVGSDDLPKEALEYQKEIVAEQIKDKVKNKPEEIASKIYNGKLNKWINSVTLLNQTSVSDNDKTIEQLRSELVSKLGENVVVKRFVRWELGSY